MSQIVFEQIFCYLHLANKYLQVLAGALGDDKLFKVWQFVDLVTAEFESLYTLHQQVTTDEAMIPFKGRLGIKQCMKNKSTKWGVKVFVLGDASIGYVYWLQIYTGKQLRTQTQLWMPVYVHGLSWN